jgi:hypothetical protein
MGGEACAGPVEQSHHDLGIDEVLGAPEGYKADNRGRFWDGGAHLFIVVKM